MLKRSIKLIPARTQLYQAKLGFYLLVASLGMFFAASLITYATIRLAWDGTGQQTELVERKANVEEGFGADWNSAVQPTSNRVVDDPDVPQALHRTLKPSLYAEGQKADRVEVPIVFFASTIVLIVISLFLHQACAQVAKEKQKSFRRCLGVAMLFATVFLVVQNFGMIDLVQHHLKSANGDMKFYGIAFTLAFIHALHVYGGLVFLGFVLVKAFRNGYDHERHWSVDICAGYWHFLDVVWIAMLATFVIFG